MTIIHAEFADADDLWLRQVRDDWNERAAWWDEMSEVNAASEDRKADLARVASALHLRPRVRLLDAGCGSGQFAIAFARLGCTLTALDISGEMIERAKAHARDADVAVDWRVGNCAAILDADGSFDAIHARVVLQFLPEPMYALTEFRRVLAPGGRLLVSVPGALSPIYGRSWRRFIGESTQGNTRIVPWELEELLVHSGWKIIDQWGDVGASADGSKNEQTELPMDAYPVRVQQAIATTWTFIAE